ncbi:MAG: ParB/RepB/Spo0J family partition protein [Chloroflexi bacterium]|nr:ParB/RepB/Spo0J family partition protein [Chloroflexota bacterium]
MARRPGLGKGLDALIPSGEDKSAESPTLAGDSIQHIPVESILPNPHQPRSIINDEALNELAASILEHGILQPLIVSKQPDQDAYTLVAGERRWRAAKLAGLVLVPVIERTVTEQDQLELALIENLQRSDLSPLETAEAYRHLVEDFSLTHEQVAERVGKSRTSVTYTLRLLNLPEQVRKSLAENLISEGHARALLGLSTEAAQYSVLSVILRENLNVRQTEALVKKMSGEKPLARPKPAPSPEVSELESRLRSHFGTKVALNDGRNGGRLVIYYYSNEELNAILDKILNE